MFCFYTIYSVFDRINGIAQNSNKASQAKQIHWTWEFVVNPTYVSAAYAENSFYQILDQHVACRSFDIGDVIVEMLDDADWCIRVDIKVDGMDLIEE